MENGYGGVTRLFYRSYEQPEVGGVLDEMLFYAVRETETWDGVEYVFGDDPSASKTVYTYQDSQCWDIDNVSSGGVEPPRWPCDAPGEQTIKLFGFPQTTVQNLDANGNVLSESVHEFDTSSYWTMGRGTQTDVYEPGVQIPLRRTETSYINSTLGLPKGNYFVYTHQITNTVWENEQPHSQRTVYEYAPAMQGGAQYGNRTHVYEYDENGDLYRFQMQGFVPNTTTNWIVNQPAWSGTFDAYTTTLAATMYYYDGQLDNMAGPDDKGELTLTRNRLVPAGGPDCPGYEDTVDVSYTYDVSGNLTATTTYEGYGWIQCDSEGHWVEHSPPGDGSTAYTTSVQYDDAYNLYPVQTCNPLDQCSHTEYYEVNAAPPDGGLPGQVWRAWGPNGQATATQYRYDAFGRTTQVWGPGEDPDTGPPNRWTFYYDYVDNPPDWSHPEWRPMVSITWDKTDPDATWENFFDESASIWKRVLFDGLGRTIQTQTRAADWTYDGGNCDPEQHDIVQYTLHDALGRAITQSVPYSVTRACDDGTNPYQLPDMNQAHTTTQYDALGRAVRVENTDGTAVLTDYEGWNSLVTDERGNQKTYTSDPFGRMVEVYETPIDATTVYTYDLVDNLIEVEDDAGNHAHMGYDALGRKTWMDDPDMGDWRYAYDPAGNLIKQLDARDQAICLYYDSLGRLEGKTYHEDVDNLDDLNCPGEPYVVSYIYDQGTYGIGQRTRMDDESGYTTWTYDERGRTTEELKYVDGAGLYRTQWGYDALGRAAWIKYPNGSNGQVGERVDYDYDSRGLLNSVLGDGTYGDDSYVQSTTYDVSGRMELRVLGDDTLQADYTYYPWDALDDRGRLQQITTGTPADPDSLQDLRYTYDAVGNVLSIEDYKAASPQTQAFTYDGLNRMLTAEVTGGITGTYVYAYQYDTIGNITHKDGGEYGLSYNYYSEKPHAVRGLEIGIYTAVGYAYDANGNMTKRDFFIDPKYLQSAETLDLSLYPDSDDQILYRDTYTLTYDAENRLVEVYLNGLSVAEFVYDGDGNRVEGTMDGVTTVYVGNHYEQSDGTVRKYYYAGGQRVAMRENGTLYYLIGDHLGSTSITANADGGKQAELRYKAYGESRYAWGDTPTSFRFTGQREDDTIGLYFYNARYYDPLLGRFIQADTIVPNPGNPQDLNRYSYVRNNPLRFTDPSGHTCASPSSQQEAIECALLEQDMLDHTVLVYIEWYVKSKELLPDGNWRENQEKIGILSLGAIKSPNSIYTHDHFLPELGPGHFALEYNLTDLYLMDANGETIADPTLYYHDIRGFSGVMHFNLSEVNLGPAVEEGDPYELSSGSELGKVVRGGDTSAEVEWVQFVEWASPYKWAFLTTGNTAVGDSGGGTFLNGRWVGSHQGKWDDNHGVVGTWPDIHRVGPLDIRPF